MKLFKQQNLFFVFFLSLIISVGLYYQLFFTFYQQDEWNGIGHMLANGIFAEVEVQQLNIVQILFGEGRILTNIVNYVLFLAIPFNITFISLYAIILHGANAALVGYLVSIIFKNKVATGIALLVFLVNSVSDQAVIWFGASVSVLTATFFVLLSLIYFYQYITANKNNYLLLSYLFLFISFYFKELGLGFLPLYFLLYVLYKGKKNFVAFLKVSLIPIIYFLLFIGIRVGTMLLSSQKVGEYVNASSPIKTLLLSNFILYSFSSLSQLFIPPKLIFSFAAKIVTAAYPFISHNPQSDLISQTIGSDMITIFISTLVLIGLALTFRTKRNYGVVLFSLGIIIASVLPYITIMRGSSYLESRYYYLSVVGISVLMAYIYLYIKEKSKNIIPIIFFVFLFFYLSMHYLFIQDHLVQQSNFAQQRLMILNSIKKSGVKITDNTVIYIKSDKDYVVAGNPLPFQEGIGYTLLVWLYTSNHTTNQLLGENYLWDLGSQGYKKTDTGGYGFFSDFTSLKDAFETYQFDPGTVYAYSWDSVNNSLTNITDRIRKQL